MPIVVTLHTVLREPRADQRLVIAGTDCAVDAAGSDVGARAADAAGDLPAPPTKIDLIQHGIPDVPFVDPNDLKEQFGVEGGSCCSRSGCLSPNRASSTCECPAEDCGRVPNVVYMVVGATHPNELREQGEAYRVSLEILAARNKVEKNVIFYNSFRRSRHLEGFHRRG